MDIQDLTIIYTDRNGNELKVRLVDDYYIDIFNGRNRIFDLTLDEIEALYHYSRLVKINSIEKEYYELEEECEPKEE